MRLWLKLWLAGWCAVLAPVRVARGDGCLWASRYSAEGVGSPASTHLKSRASQAWGQGQGAAQMSSDAPHSSLSLQHEPPPQPSGRPRPSPEALEDRGDHEGGPLSGGLRGSPARRAQPGPRKRLQRRLLQANPPWPPDGWRRCGGCDNTLQELRPDLVWDRLSGRAPSLS